MARLTGPEVNQGAPYRYITCSLMPRRARVLFLLPFIPALPLLPKVRAVMDPKNNPRQCRKQNFFFSRKWLASAARYYTRQQKSYRIVLHQSQHVALTSVSRYLQVGPGRMGDMSDPPSARISRASSTVPDVAGKLGFVSMVTDACAGDAILVCPGRGAPSTVPFRWQKRPLPSVSQSRRITLFEIGPVNLLQKRRSDEPSKMKKSPHLRQINMDCFGASSTSHVGRMPAASSRVLGRQSAECPVCPPLLLW